MLGKGLKRKDGTLKRSSVKKETFLAENFKLHEPLETCKKSIAPKILKIRHQAKQIVTFKSEKINLQKKVLYLRKSRSEVRVNEKTEQHCLKTIVKQFQNENKDLHQLIILMDGPEILTFVNGKYIDEIRTIITDILTLNVSMTKVDN